MLSILVATGRTVAPHLWVVSMAQKIADQQAAALPHNVLKGYYERQAD